MSHLDSESSGGALPDTQQLAEALLDAAAMGNFEIELARVQSSIDRLGGQIDPLSLFGHRVLCFDLAVVSTTDNRLQAETAASLLTCAIASGGSAWMAILASPRIDEIERLALTSEFRIELLELLAYAPDVDVRGFAVNSIELAGTRALGRGDDSRMFERLLHAIGATTHAYRLESARKQRRAAHRGQRTIRETHVVASKYHMVAIAGGHAQLRGTAAVLLQRHGIGIVQIPSSREAVRRERDIIGLLQGCDLAILLVRQITHSTSDQVRKVAERLNIPVIYSNALSAVAIERQLLERKR